MGEDMGETKPFGVPSYDFAIPRHRLIQVFNLTAPDVTVVVAPGGYGKTVLAAQLAQVVGAACLWLSMGGCSPSHADFPGAVAAKLRPRAARHLETGARVSQAPGSGWDCLEAELAGVSELTSMVVLDGFDSVESTEAIFVLLEMLRRLLGRRVRLVCTCRTVGRWFKANTHDASLWVVSRDELQFTVGQTAELAEHVTQRSILIQEASALTLSSGGQAALLVLLLRHVACSGQTVEDILRHAPRDVGDYLRTALISELDEPLVRVLGAAALLGAGSIEELARVTHTDVGTVLAAAVEVPLLRLTSDSLGARGFEMHDLAGEVFGAVALEAYRSAGSRALDPIIRELEGRADYRRLFSVLSQANDPDYLVESVERHGGALLEDANLGLLESILAKIPASTQAGSVRLLLLGAMLLRCNGQVHEALDRAASARRLAATRGDSLLERECLMVEARLRFDVCEFGVLIEPLERACDAAIRANDHDTAALLSAYLATAHAQLGEVTTGREFVEQYKRLYHLKGVSSGTRAKSVSMILLVLGIICGDVSSAATVLKEARSEPGQSIESRLLCDGNLAALLLEMGRLHASLELSDAAQILARDRGLTFLVDSFKGTEAAARAGAGDTAGAGVLMAQAIDSAVCPEDTSNIAYNRVYRSTISRAGGLLDEALSDAEHAVALFSQEESGLPIMACLARCEVAASMLAIGDVSPARELALRSRSEAASWTAAYHLLRADMVLAEIERQQGDADAAVARIAQHVDYVLTESANWQVAMYIRAFPGLLGVFAKAIGPDALPSHLLRMVLPDFARPALEASAMLLSAESLERLAVRLLGKRGAAIFLRERASGPKAHIRLFGGMEVVTPSGVVTDKHWRKRKARLLFALLVLRRGHDMPREQVFEHFWPEMDEDRAKSNFYVTWSIMKRALALGVKDAPCPYVEHVGGVCRVVPAAVSSDYAEFEDALVAMRKADRAGDTVLALASAERVFEQYRGELLPGEIYDDWLGPMRDRCRHDYGDAMLRAAQIHHEAGDTEKALHMVRAALGQDPWREDLYQGALRYLIHSGQRSGAIETYVACKSKLAEDLGLDPSVETRRLYDQILAMEGPPAAPAQA